MAHDIEIIVFKEMKEFVNERTTLVLFLALGILLGTHVPVAILESQIALLGSLQGVFDSYSGFLFLAITLAISWGPTSWVFMREKSEGTFETLLTTPLSLRVIWLGKAAAVFILSYGYSFLCALLLMLRLNLSASGVGRVILPSPLGWWNLLIVAPLFVFACIALNGWVQLLFAHPRIGHYIVLVVTFLVFRAGSRLILQNTPWVIGGYTAIALGLLAATLLAARWLNKERIVLSIG